MYIWQTMLVRLHYGVYDNLPDVQVHWDGVVCLV